MNKIMRHSLSDDEVLASGVIGSWCRSWEVELLEEELDSIANVLLEFAEHITKYNYHVSNPILNKHNLLLNKLKEGGGK